MNTLFLLSAFIFSLTALSVPVQAQTKKTYPIVQQQTTSTTKDTTTKDVAMKQKVEYQLPFPGILPDHPLYMVKALRDRILEFLIVEPVRKTEFYLLQADKRLGMGAQLLDKGNTALAETTLSKGKTYMDKAVSTIVNYKAGGKEVPGYLVDRLTRSLAKHGEVLEELVARASETTKPALSGVLDTVKKLQLELEKIK